MNNLLFSLASRSLWLIVIRLSLPYPVQAQITGSGDNDEKPVHVLESPAQYTGPSDSPIDLDHIDTVKIGLFLAQRNNSHLIKAAEMAASEYNDMGGFHGKKFRIVQRWAENPWAAGSKEMIKLIYEDSVWAIIGSHDGNTTHIAEQVVTKARITLISPISADPTLNYVNIPWMFRLPPDYRLQAIHLLEKGIKIHSGSRVGLISTDNHDGRIFSQNMNKALSMNGTPAIFHFEITKVADLTNIMNRSISFNPDGLVLQLSPESLTSLLKDLEKINFSGAVFIPWIPGMPAFELNAYQNLQIYQVQPFSVQDNAMYISFEKRFNDLYGILPMAEDAYMYDAMSMVMNAIKISGLSRAKIRSTIAELTAVKGVTGIIDWDNGGGNTAKPVLHIVNLH